MLKLASRVSFPKSENQGKVILTPWAKICEWFSLVSFITPSLSPSREDLFTTHAIRSYLGIQVNHQKFDIGISLFNYCTLKFHVKFILQLIHPYHLLVCITGSHPCLPSVYSCKCCRYYSMLPKLLAPYLPI